MASSPDLSVSREARMSQHRVTHKRKCHKSTTVSWVGSEQISSRYITLHVCSYTNILIAILNYRKTSPILVLLIE